ncbi:beta strand repeat-containing protein [Fimbriiglobus ruber]|uniref:beta strand repeat-containing protein n=1 Tax=Fimbriiglobus ruber TaxID=1908690 RepID=UPI003B84B4D8
MSASNSLVGSTANDTVGSEFGGSVVVLPSGNYLVASPDWSGNEGAVTFGSGTAGVSGVVSASNSLVGSAAGDNVGSAVTILTSGNYAVASPGWSGGTGAVTLGSGTTGISGLVSASNSLVGSTAGDSIGTSVTALPNGNYVVASPNWSGNIGAVTFGSGTAGVSGVVSVSNSLVGSTSGDDVGKSVTPLPSGNYVMASPGWSGGTGAVTLGSGTTGISGLVSASNSLVGSTAGDSIGTSVTALPNGNYVVASPNWSGNIGAVTFGSGTAGVSGVVSVSNSLVGSTSGDDVGKSVTPLPSGNYVMASPGWSGGTGAVTLGSGTTGISGLVSASNSLVGSTAGDSIGTSVTALPNGNYVVASPNWSGNIGAVTFGSGTAGVSGVVSASNSLVGSTANDSVGNNGITALTNGNYVIPSPYWSGGKGAATFGNGTTGVIGVVSATNSLVGSTASDFIGAENTGPTNHFKIAILITAFANGNYVVASPNWSGGIGAVTFGSGTAGVSGAVSASNSIVGSAANAGLGTLVIDNTNGNFYAPFTTDGGGRVRVGSLTTGPVATGSQSPLLLGYPQVAVGADAGGTGTVTVYNPDQSAAYTATPFGAAFTDGVRVAVADLNGDGAPELIAGTGPGVANQVVVLDGTTHNQLASFNPFETTFTGGLYVTVGDVNGDGVPDLIVTPDESGGPIVAVYDGAALGKGQVMQLVRFFGINDPNFRGGARAAVGDINGDGYGDVIVSAGFGGGPRVAIYSGKSVAANAPTELLPDFFAFEPSLRNGAYVTAGDLTGKGFADLIFGAGPGGGPRVRAVDPAVLLAAAGDLSSLDDAAVSGASLADFFAGDVSNRGGVRVGVADLDASNQAGLVVGSGTGAGATVTTYTGKAIEANPEGPAEDFAIDSMPGFTGGIYVG